jgi:F-type H+-transporting ATPase subunit b
VRGGGTVPPPFFKILEPTMLKSLRLALLLTPLAVTPAFAQEGGLLDINEGLMVWTVLIFLLVLGILMWKAYPPILRAVEARERHIRELLEAAARDREEAEALLEEQRRERDAVRAQVQAMLAEGRSGAEKTREEILAEARREQQELLERSRRDIEREMERSMAELRLQVVDIAIAAASKLVQRNLNDDDNRRLVREFVEQIELREPVAGAVGG